MVRHPADREFKDMASNKLVPNCPITTHDISNENSMFGPELSGVKGKTPRKKPSKVNTEEYLRILEAFYKFA